MNNNPYLRAAARLRHEAEQKLLQRQLEESGAEVIDVDAIEVIDVAVIERARDELGQFIGDDPSTPDVNEAWVEVPQGE
jgi:hypothetical protein